MNLRPYKTIRRQAAMIDALTESVIKLRLAYNNATEALDLSRARCDRVERDLDKMRERLAVLDGEAS